jgi:glycerol uptake facilitator protein
MFNSSSFTGELLGTLTLVLLGSGVVSNVLLSKTKGQNSGTFMITAGWAFAVMMGVFVAQKFGSQDAHLNPAITIAMAIRSGDWSNVHVYILAQLIGAILGSTLMYIAYKDHFKETDDAGLKLAVFSTSPAIKNNVSNLITEAIATAVLVLGCIAITSESGSGVGPYLVGVLVWGIGVSLGGPTGYAINPARDLGPRIAHAILPIQGKGDSDWGYAWVPVLGPILGGVIAALIF